MIRFIVTAVFFLLFFILSFPVLLIEKLAARRDPEKAKDNCTSVIRFATRVTGLIAGIKLETEGLEKIPEGPVLFIGNHRSLFDFVVTYPLLDRRISYLGKDSFGKIPVFRLWMPMIRMLMLNRSDPREGLKTILDAISYIRQGVSVFIFPEGTRSRSADQSVLLPFHEGSFKPAIKTGCPIVPVVMLGTSEIFESHIPVIRPGRVRLIVLDPLTPDSIPEQYRKKPAAYVRELMINAIISEEKENTDV